MNRLLGLVGQQDWNLLPIALKHWYFLLMNLETPISLISIFLFLVTAENCFLIN